MENLLNEIEQIMMPYYDNKREKEERNYTDSKEVEILKTRLSMLTKSRIEERQNLIKELVDLKGNIDREIDLLSVKLKNIRDEKENEINEYILNESVKLNRDLEDQPYQLSKYFSNIKEELEKEYDEKEKELLSQIKKLEQSKLQLNESNTNTNDFYAYRANQLNMRIKLLENESQNEIELRNKIDLASKRPAYDVIDIYETIDVKDEVGIALNRFKTKVQEELYKKNFKRIKILSSVRDNAKEFEQEQNKYKEIIEKLSQFGVKQDSIGQEEWVELYNELNKVSERMNELKNSASYEIDTYDIDNEISDLKSIIEKIDKNLEIVDTAEELKIIGLRSRSDSERKELNRRKNLRDIRYGNNTTNSNIEENDHQNAGQQDFVAENNKETFDFDFGGQFDEQGLNNGSEGIDFNKDENGYENPISDSNNAGQQDSVAEDNKDLQDTIPLDLVDSYTPVNYTYRLNADGEIFVDSMNELCKLVYRDILDSTKDMKSIKLDPGSMDNAYYFSSKSNDNYEFDGTVTLNNSEGFICLPNGEYLNLVNINDALDNLYNRNKGVTYKVQGVNNGITVSKSKVNELKSNLQKCSAVKLINDNKINDSDIKRAYGSDSNSEFFTQDIGQIKTSLPAGEYISRNEFIAMLKDVFETEKVNWFKNIASKLNKGSNNSTITYGSTSDDEKIPFHR